MEVTTTEQEKRSSGTASFAVPRAAIDALIDAHADAVTIGAYLTLACHTDKTGMFSSASLHAIRDNLAVNRKRAEKAVHTLCAIQGKITNSNTTPPPSRSRKKAAEVPMSPLVYARDSWLTLNGGELPDGPHPRAKILHVLPTFDEPLKDRVWFGSGLVRGDDLIEQPLKQLRDCDDVAARLLLAMYAGQDMERWSGIPPHGFPWVYYKQREEVATRVKILFAESGSTVGPTTLFNRIDPGRANDKGKACFAAVAALESCGFLYQAVVVLNRDPIASKFANGDAYGEVPSNADIMCDLGSPSLGGSVSHTEQGLGDAYVQTATDLNLLAQPYDYLAVLSTGRPAMICGLYRLRFRVTHHSNAFVQESDRRQLDANRDAFRELNYLRKAKKLATMKHGTSTLQSFSILLNPSQ